MLTKFNRFSYLSQWKHWREYHAIYIELVNEWMVLFEQSESNPIDEDRVDNLWIIIFLLKYNSICLNLVKFFENLLLG